MTHHKGGVQIEGGKVQLYKYVDCIDAGTEFCPCKLAEQDECIICSQIHGKCFCDCLNWKGICIYQEFIWNNKKCRKSRQYHSYVIEDKQYIREDLLQLDIKVSKYLARELNNVGAFVFLKAPGDPDSFSTPISVMLSDTVRNIIRVVIKIYGVKTKALCKCERDIMVKGPYWNGIQGQRFLSFLKNSNVLIIARGVAAAPGVMAAKKLIKKGNHVYVLLDRGRSSENFTKKYYESLGCIVQDTSLCDRSGNFTASGERDIKSLVEKLPFKTVLCAGSDDFYEKTIGLIHKVDNSIKFATVNNSTMCCGEGICGSCILEGSRNKHIKSCKQQYNPMEIFLKEGE